MLMKQLLLKELMVDVLEKIKSEAITGDLVVVTLDTELDSDDS
jgi:hypothetical protein